MATSFVVGCDRPPDFFWDFFGIFGNFWELLGVSARWGYLLGTGRDRRKVIPIMTIAGAPHRIYEYSNDCSDLWGHLIGTDHTPACLPSSPMTH